MSAQISMAAIPNTTLQFDVSPLPPTPKNERPLRHCRSPGPKPTPQPRQPLSPAPRECFVAVGSCSASGPIRTKPADRVPLFGWAPRVCRLRPVMGCIRRSFVKFRRNIAIHAVRLAALHQPNGLGELPTGMAERGSLHGSGLSRATKSK